MDNAGSARSNNPAREARILDAAARLIAHYGYDKTTVGDIAQEAGVSKGAVYLHWESKEDLFEALIQREMWRYAEDWISRLEANPDDLTLAGLFKAALLALKANPFVQALITRDRQMIGSFLMKRHSSLISVRMAFSRELFQTMQAAGAIRADVDVEKTAYILSAMSYGFLTIGTVIPPEQTPPLDEVMEEMSRLLDRALTPPDGSGKEAARQIIAQIIATSRAAMAAMWPNSDQPRP